MINPKSLLLVLSSLPKPSIALSWVVSRSRSAEGGAQLRRVLHHHPCVELHEQVDLPRLKRRMRRVVVREVLKLTALLANNGLREVAA